MKIVTAVKQEPLTHLYSVTPGRVIRFHGFTYEECLTGKDDATFYMVVKPVKDNGRITLISLDGLSLIERDAVTMVHLHDAETAVYPIRQ